MPTNTLRRTCITLTAVAGCFVFATSLTGCKEKGTMEEAGAQLDDAAKKASDAADDAAKAAADKIDDAGDAAKKAADDAAKALEGGG